MNPRDRRNAITERRAQEERCRTIALGRFGKEPRELPDIERYVVLMIDEMARFEDPVVIWPEPIEWLPPYPTLYESPRDWLPPELDEEA